MNVRIKQSFVKKKLDLGSIGSSPSYAWYWATTKMILIAPKKMGLVIETFKIQQSNNIKEGKEQLHWTYTNKFMSLSQGLGTETSPKLRGIWGLYPNYLLPLRPSKSYRVGLWPM